MFNGGDVDNLDFLDLTSDKNDKLKVFDKKQFQKTRELIGTQLSVLKLNELQLIAGNPN